MMKYGTVISDPVRVCVTSVFCLQLRGKAVKPPGPVVKVGGDPVSVDLVTGLYLLQPLPVPQLHHLAEDPRYAVLEGGHLG